MVLSKQHCPRHTSRTETLDFYAQATLSKGFPGGSMEKNPPDNAGDASSSPGSGRSLGEGNGNPLQYSCLERPIDRGGLQSMGPQRFRHDQETKQQKQILSKEQSIPQWKMNRRKKIILGNSLRLWLLWKQNYWAKLTMIWIDKADKSEHNSGEISTCPLQVSPYLYPRFSCLINHSKTSTNLEMLSSFFFFSVNAF